MQIVYDIFDCYIFWYLDLLSQLRLKASCRLLYELPITDLYNISVKYRNLLTQKIISQYPYTKKLYAKNNPNIVSVNMFKYLEILHAGNKPDMRFNEPQCGIDQNGISHCITIKKLNVDSNYNINNLNHMTELILLSAKSCMDVESNIVITSFINCIKLQALCIEHTSCFCSCDLNIFKDLRYLYAHCCRLSSECFDNCNLVCLDIGGNGIVHSLDMFPNLETLWVENIDISNINFYKLPKLKRLSIYESHTFLNYKILNLNCLHELEYLSEGDNNFDIYYDNEWCKRVKYLSTTLSSVNTDFINFENLETLIVNQTYEEYMFPDTWACKYTGDDINKCPKIKTIASLNSGLIDGPFPLRGNFDKYKCYYMKYYFCDIANEGDNNLFI